MSWSNLLSGIIGAVLGGLLAIIASFITMRQQQSLALATFAEDRRQAQLRASYSACTEILNNMLIIKQAMQNVMTGPRSDAITAFKTAYDSAERIFIVYNTLVADGDLRSRINELKGVVEQWYQNTEWETDKSVQGERYELVVPFMEYINLSIRAHLDNQSLPPAETPPNLLAEKKSSANTG
jgi:hypothetical protein